MTEKEIVLDSQMKALKKIDLSPMIRMGGMFTPRLLGGFLPKLSPKQRKAFDQAMPASGGKKFFVHLKGTPTPPIVIEMANPLKMDILPEAEVKKQGLKGLTLTIEDLQLAKDKKFGKFFWRIKGQTGTLLGLSGMAAPFVKLGPKEIKDMKNKAMIHFKPLFDMMPR